MTRREFLEMVINGKVDRKVVEFAKNEIEKRILLMNKFVTFWVNIIHFEAFYNLNYIWKFLAKIDFFFVKVFLCPNLRNRKKSKSECISW